MSSVDTSTSQAASTEASSSQASTSANTTTAASGRCTRIGGSFHCSDIAADESRDQAAADFVPTEKLYVRCLHHRVDSLDQCDEAFGLDHAESLVCFCHKLLLQEKKGIQTKIVFFAAVPAVLKLQDQ